MLEKVKKKAKIYVGREAAKQFKNFRRFRCTLLNYPKDRKERPPFPQRFIDLSDYLYKIYLSEEENSAKILVRLDLIVDWDHFTESFKRSFDGACFHTKRNADLFFTVGLMSWICEPKFPKQNKENFRVLPVKFTLPKKTVAQIEEYVKAIRLESVQDEHQYRSQKYFEQKHHKKSE